VLTTSAYRQFCGVPLWVTLRDVIRHADVDDPRWVASDLREIVGDGHGQPVPRPSRSLSASGRQALKTGEFGLAVRSSAVGEGGERGRTDIRRPVPHTDQCPIDQAVGCLQTSHRRQVQYESPGLPAEYGPPRSRQSDGGPVPAGHSRPGIGIMYTRDPGRSQGRGSLVTSTHDGMDVASGTTPVDLFMTVPKAPHAVVGRHLARKNEEYSVAPERAAAPELDPGEADRPSLEERELATLTSGASAWRNTSEGRRTWSGWSTRTPDLDPPDEALALVNPKGHEDHGTREPILGRRPDCLSWSGLRPVCLLRRHACLAACGGSVVFLRRASPEIVGILPASPGWLASGAMSPDTPLRC